MTDSTVSTRRARSRAARQTRSRPAGLVVALMMALVFVPVLALHVVALVGATREADRPAEFANATHKPPVAKKVPG